MNSARGRRIDRGMGGLILLRVPRREKKSEISVVTSKGIHPFRNVTSSTENKEEESKGIRSVKKEEETKQPQRKRKIASAYPPGS